MADAQASMGATMLAGGQVDQAALKQAEQAVAFEWKPGDVILDLYEVRKVTEGFGEDAEEKDYHEGGFGRVYKVWHRTWRREMAVKTPRAGVFTTQEQKDTFIRECETWVNLGLHAHIAACHYVRELGGVPRVFSEYADAGTLEEWIRSQRLYEGDEQSALARMLNAAIQFAWGLHYAHERGVIHQDVKPLNALMWNDGTLKVTDFGLAGARQKVGIADMAGEGTWGCSIMVAAGGMTPSHCSPEQAAGQKLDRRTDVWSWAVSVLEMFQGEVTWQSGSLAAEALEAFLTHGGKEEDIPAMPKGVADLLRWCFQQNPANRPHTLHDCAAVLCEVYQAEIGKPYPRTEPQSVGDTPDALNNRALSFIDLGKPDEAERLFDRALEMDKHHLAATYNRGLMRWRAGRCTDMDLLESLEEIKKDHPSDASVECALGRVRMESGRFKEAVDNFVRAVELGDDSEARRGLEHARTLACVGAGQCLRTFNGHKRVRSGVFSSDGRFILSGSDNNTLRLWDVATGQCLRTFEGHTRGGIRSVAFSPDGRFALSGSLGSLSEPKVNTLVLWDVTTGKYLRTFEENTSAVYSVAFSPDGRFALSGSLDYKLKLWDVDTGQCLRTFEGHEDSVESVALSPDGRFAVSGSRDKILRLWNVATGQCLRTFEGHTKGGKTSVAFSPDGRFVLSGSWDHTLRLWDVSTGQCLRNFEGHTEEVTSVAFSSNGRFVLSGSWKTLRLWDIATGQCLRSFEGHTEWIYSVAFSPDGCFALSGGDTLSKDDDKTLRLWDVSSVMERCFMAPWVYSMVVTVEDAIERQRLYEAHLSNACQAFEAENIAESLAFLRQAREVPGFEKSPESLELQARIGARARIKSYGGGWLKCTFEEYGTPVWSVAFSPNGHLVLSASWDNTLRLWDVATGKCLRTFEGHTDRVWSVAYSPDGRFALSGSWDHTLRLWEIATGQCLRAFEGHARSVMSVAFSPDGLFVLSGGGLYDGTLRLWNIATGQCLRTFEGHTNEVYSVAFSPDGRFALSGSEDHTLRLWELATGKYLRTFNGHARSVKSVAFSPDGRFALSGSDDTTLRLWDVSTGECLRTFEGHKRVVHSVAYSPDGRFALSGSDDTTLRLWDVGTGQCLRTFEGHTRDVSSVAFSPDGRFALSGNKDGAIRLWELDWEYEYDPEYDPVLKRSAEEEAHQKAEAERKRKEQQTQRKRKEKARRRAEEEAWNHSLLGRITNLFTGKGRKK